MEHTFRLVAVEKTPPPDGAQPGRWHRYTIESNYTVIHGYACGTKVEVSTYAKEYVQQLNERTNGRPGAATWSPRKGRKATQ